MKTKPNIYEIMLLTSEEAHNLLKGEIKKEDPDFELIRDIFEYSVVDINSKDYRGMTTLMCATIWGNEKIIELLLRHPEIDVNIQDEEIGWSALIYAVYNLQPKSVELLLKHPKIDVNVQDQWDRTALMYTVSDIYDHKNIKKIEAIIDLLLQQSGIDANLQDEDGMTASMWASSHGYELKHT